MRPTSSLSILTEIKTGISLIIELIFKSLDVLSTLEDGTVIDKDSGPRTPDKDKIKSLNPAF